MDDLSTYSRTRLEGALAVEQGDDAEPQTERGRAIVAELERRDRRDAERHGRGYSRHPDADAGGYLNDEAGDNA